MRALTPTPPRSATTRLVNRLEDRELLTRILCLDDRASNGAPLPLER